MKTISAKDATILHSMINALDWPVLDLWVDGTGKWWAELDDTGLGYNLLGSWGTETCVW